jgi:DeoR/GlpR family transcriptional regulator of sugar metabolism
MSNETQMPPHDFRSPSSIIPSELAAIGGIVWEHPVGTVRIRGWEGDVARHLLPTDRRQIIADLVRERGSVRGSELVGLLGVTNETVRRDLELLARLGVVHRNHGGAVAAFAHDDSTTAVRVREHGPEKVAIGRRAAQLVSPGTTLILDSGTTTLCLARALRSMRDLVVVTTAVTNALELVGNPDTTVVMSGGVIRPNTFGASGQLAVDTLKELRVDQAFVAIHSVSARGGLMYPTFEEVDAKRAMIEAASEVILLADHSKFGRESLVRVAPITAVDRIVSSPGIDPDEEAAIRELGIDLIIAEVDEPTPSVLRLHEAGDGQPRTRRQVTT